MNNKIHGNNFQSIQDYRIQNHKSILSSMFDFENDSTSGIKNNNLRLFSSLKIDNQKPEQIIGISSKGSIENISFLFEPVIVNAPHGPNILGVDYIRNSFSGRIENAYISINNDFYKLRFGRGPVNWGLNSQHSIIQSRLYPHFDNISFGLQNKNYFLEVLHGQLSSGRNNDGARIKRNFAGHRLSWKGKDLNICFGEQIIYTGVNRGLEIPYLNPFIPYFFTGLEGEEVSSPKDNDNSIVFFYGNYFLNKYLSVFSEIIIDDYQVDEESNSDHAIGYKIGLIGKTIWFKQKQNWVLEYSYISPWTYIHHGQNTSWSQRGHSIGYPYGPDSECFQLQVLSNLNDKYYLYIDLKLLHKGDKDLNTNWDNLDKGKNTEINLTKRIFSNISINKEIDWGIIEFGWSNLPFYSEIALSNNFNQDRGSIFIKLKIIKDIDLIL